MFWQLWQCKKKKIVLAIVAMPLPKMKKKNIVLVLSIVAMALLKMEKKKKKKGCSEICERVKKKLSRKQYFYNILTINHT